MSLCCGFTGLRECIERLSPYERGVLQQIQGCNDTLESILENAQSNDPKENQRIMDEHIQDISKLVEVSMPGLAAMVAAGATVGSLMVPGIGTLAGAAVGGFTFTFVNYIFPSMRANLIKLLGWDIMKSITDELSARNDQRENLATPVLLLQASSTVDHDTAMRLACRYLNHPALAEFTTHMKIQDVEVKVKDAADAAKLSAKFVNFFSEIYVGGSKVPLDVNAIRIFLVSAV